MRRVILVLLLAIAVRPAGAQSEPAGAARAKAAIERLNVAGSVLMIAAHPDDESTAVLAYFARGRHVRTGYLSLTRGEGGQNLIGSELGEKIGLIRTQELLAARRIDGAEQYFTRAVDFGFSKSAAETLSKWGREEVLADVVWTIRRFRPDVIILRFSGTPRDGHGHHQASAMLGKDAFEAAADPKRFPEQLQWVQPWRARRVVWNVFSFSREQEREASVPAGQVEIDTGEFNPLLGYSYEELAAVSRSLHRSQAMGSAGRRGSVKQRFVHVAGEPAQTDLFDGIDTTWKRVGGGQMASLHLVEAMRAFADHRPENAVPALLKARAEMARLQGYWPERKLAEIDEAIAACTGLWLDAAADQAMAFPGGTVAISLDAVNRSGIPMRLEEIRIEGARIPASTVRVNRPLPYNDRYRGGSKVQIPDDHPYSQPYWLRAPRRGDLYTVTDRELLGLPEGPPVLEAHFRVGVQGETVEFRRPVRRRYVDRALGELTRPMEIAPPVAVRISDTPILFPTTAPRNLEVEIRANAPAAKGTVRIEAPHGWRTEPAAHSFEIGSAGEQRSVTFRVTPPAGETRCDAIAVVTVGGREIRSSMHVIEYPHIDPQTTFPPSSVALVRTDVKNLAARVGYVMGAGDAVPDALRQIGSEVTLLDADALAHGDLSRFDAIVTGVRAYNQRADLRANHERLMEYVKAGGTLVVQYNVAEGGFFSPETGALARIGPYPLKVGRQRVVEEDAPVVIPDPAHPVLQKPNPIRQADFEGWVQERGLYFASEWDPRYQPLFSSHDAGENPLPGGMLYTRYGDGVYMFTGYAWFRQLPAGVPGAYRIFANLISAGKALR
ncbi:MAG: PIG-L family deacetylase [Bryobacteraceae bacterium]